MQVHKYDMQVTAIDVWMHVNRWQVCPMECQILWLQRQVPSGCVHWNRDLFNFWLHTIPSFLHWSRSIAAGGIWDNQPCETNFAPPGLPDPGRIPEDLCWTRGVVRVAIFFPMCSLAKCLKKSALYMRCSQAFLQQPHILSYFFRDKLATFWTHMAKWSSSVTSFCSAGRSNRAFRAQTLSPSRVFFEPLTERLLKWFGGDFAWIQITIF